MSKPKHSERYRGFYLGAGLWRSKGPCVKRRLAPYSETLEFEIRRLERIGTSCQLAKLRKYLKRVSS